MSAFFIEFDIQTPAESKTRAGFRSSRFRRKQNSDVWVPISHDDIQSAKFFDQFSADFTNAIVDFLQLETFAAGDKIMQQGEVGDKLFFLFRGVVDILIGSDETRVASLDAGSVFGEMALLGSKKRTATIRAKEFCDCRSLDQHTFQRLLRKFPEDRMLFEQMAKKRNDELRFAKAFSGSERRSSAPSLPPLRTERRNRQRETRRASLEADSKALQEVSKVLAYRLGEIKGEKTPLLDMIECRSGTIDVLEAMLLDNVATNAAEIA